jgi:fructan beta-fructosidase
MTIPRDLELKQVGGELLVTSRPSKELTKIQAKPLTLQNLKVAKTLDLSSKISGAALPCRIDLSMDKATDLSVVLSNASGEEVVIGYDKGANQYYIDRSKSGKVDFHKEFAARHVAPRFVKSSKMDMTLVIDVASVELFADEGLSVMTEIFFPNKPYNKITLESPRGILVKKLTYAKLNGIWK